MSIDLTKLGPAESWHPENWDALTLMWLKSKEGATDLAFLKLARQAFDVMIRLGWGVQQYEGKWYAFANATSDGEISWPVIPWPPGKPIVFADPFTSILEADAWMKQQEQPCDVPSATA